MTSEKKPGLLDRAKQLADKLFTKRNMAIAAPVVVGAAALSSKRVRDAVGDAAKSAGDAIASTAPARKKAPVSTPKPVTPTSAKRSVAGNTSGAKSAKPAAAAAAKAKTAAKPRAAKRQVKSAPKSGQGSA